MSSAKIRQICPTVHPSVRMDLGSHKTDFREISYLSISFEKLLKKIKVSLKSDKNKEYFTRRPIYIFNLIFLDDT